MLAKTEFDRGRYRPALDWAKQALALDDKQADAYVFLGGAEQAAGHQAAARSAYQRYLQLSPKGRYAGDVRAMLGSLKRARDNASGFAHVVFDETVISPSGGHGAWPSAARWIRHVATPVTGSRGGMRR